MTDLFDDIEEEAEDLNGPPDDVEDEDEDESAPEEEPEERPMKSVGAAPMGAIVPQGKQGVFADRESVFDTKRTVDHRNPVVTRAEETANELLPGRRPVSTKAQLVAVFDAQGRPFVAYHQNGRALERFRMPTPQEFEILKARGQLVKGGLGEAGPVTAPVAPSTLAAPLAPPVAPGMNKTWLYVGAAAVAVGGLAWWYMSKQKKPRSNESDAGDDGADGGDDGED